MSILKTIVRNIKRFFNRIFRRLFRRAEYSTSRKIERGIENKAKSVVSKKTGAESASFDALTASKEQFAASWPFVPKEQKEQIFTENNEFNQLPEDLKTDMLAINRKKGDKSPATEAEQETISKVFDILTEK